MMNNEQLASFHRDGFALVRGVFTQDEVLRFRRDVENEAARAKASGRFLKPAKGELVPIGDLCTLGPLADFVFDERIVSCAKAVLGAPEVIYFGDSSIMVGGDLRGFHKDNSVRYDGRDEDWARPYEMVRFGVYLDPHDRYSGGLKVRVGSHLSPDIVTGRIYDLPTRPGDLVMWSLRTTHSGAAKRLKSAPWVGLDPRVEERLPNYLVRPGPSPRLAAFLTFARAGGHLERYLQKHNDESTFPNNYLLQSWRHSEWSSQHQKRADRIGLVFRKPCPDYGTLVSTKVEGSEGLVAGRPIGELSPPGRLQRAKQLIANAVEELRGTL